MRPQRENEFSGPSLSRFYKIIGNVDVDFRMMHFYGFTYVVSDAGQICRPIVAQLCHQFGAKDTTDGSINPVKTPVARLSLKNQTPNLGLRRYYY